MAHLGTKATDGRLSFVKYVTDNKRFAEIDFTVEKGKTALLYQKNNAGITSTGKEYKEGIKFKITDKDLYTISGIKLAAVKIGNEKGFFPINSIRKPTGGNGTQYEDEVVDGINEYIIKAGGTVDFKLKGDTAIYKDIRYAIKVDTAIKRLGGARGDPKADIILCKDIKKPLAAGSIYISHKKEGGPEAFQQYGGLSIQAGAQIANHKLVQKFLEQITNILGDSKQLPAPVMGLFDDPLLANMSIYGPDYGRDFSLQHTQIIGQGNPIFKETPKAVELNFSSHMSLSGDLSHFKNGYLPVFGATFRSGRGFDYKGKRYDGARVAIYPKKLMATRSKLITLNIE